MLDLSTQDAHFMLWTESVVTICYNRKGINNIYVLTNDSFVMKEEIFCQLEEMIHALVEVVKNIKNVV